MKAWVFLLRSWPSFHTHRCIRQNANLQQIPTHNKSILQQRQLTTPISGPNLQQVSAYNRTNLQHLFRAQLTTPNFNHVVFMQYSFTCSIHKDVPLFGNIIVNVTEEIQSCVQFESFLLILNMLIVLEIGQGTTAVMCAHGSLLLYVFVEYSRWHNCPLKNCPHWIHCISLGWR